MVEVGLSMAPVLLTVDFLLICTLHPTLTAATPTHWTPVPGAVVAAMDSSGHGRVPTPIAPRLSRSARAMVCGRRMEPTKRMTTAIGT